MEAIPQLRFSLSKSVRLTAKISITVLGAQRTLNGRDGESCTFQFQARAQSTSAFPILSSAHSACMSGPPHYGGGHCPLGGQRTKCFSKRVSEGKCGRTEDFQLSEERERQRNCFRGGLSSHSLLPKLRGS